MLLSLVTAVKTLQLEFNFYYLLALYKVFLFPCTNSLNNRYALKYRLTLFYLLHAAVYLFSNQCYATMKFFLLDEGTYNYRMRRLFHKKKNIPVLKLAP